MAYIVKVVSRDTSPADHWKYGYMMERYIMCSHWMICDSSYQSNMVYLMDLCLEISFKLLRSRSYIYSIFSIFRHSCVHFFLFIFYLDLYVSNIFYSSMSPYYQEFEEDSQNDEWSTYFERPIAR